MRRVLTACWIALTIMAVVGCGGSPEKNKNKDFDRPKPAAEGER